MLTKTIRVGIVGAGRNTRGMHIPGLRAIDGVDIVSVSNRSRESSERVAAEFNIPTVYDNWAELVRAPDTDAILIGTWPYMHCPITLAALEAGKHVMCEARMAMTAAEAREMYDASRRKPHLVAQVVPSPFTLRVDKTIQRLLSEGYLGEVLAIKVLESRGFIDRDAPLHWRQDVEFSGYNVMSLGIWYEGLLRLVGPATRVVAMGKTFVKMRHDPQSGTVRSVLIPEHLDVIADMACGAQAHFGLSQVSGLRPAREMTLFGSEGTLCFVPESLYGGRRGDSSLAEIDIPPDEQGQWRVEQEFIAAIRGKEDITYTSFEDGVKYMEFTEAVMRSIKEGTAVSLPL